MNIKNSCIRVICISVVMVMLLGCGNSKNYGLSPKEPTLITVWHYYNGTQKNAFDKLVKEFNETLGLEEGIIVEAHNHGDVTELESGVIAAVNEEVGSEKMPNIFASYADTAYLVNQIKGLANLDNYLTKEEQGEYVESYLDEGRIGKEGELMIFPIAKSSEIIILNKTAWDEFAKDVGVNLDSLQTVEGVTKVAEEYYKWTDSLTPNVANDGKAFYGRDAIANYILIGSMQLGQEIFQVESQKVTLNLDKSVMRKLWDNYYVPYIKGYYGAYGRFRSDDVKVGKLIAYTGSSTSVSYFPSEVTLEEDIIEIESCVLPNSVFENGNAVQVQQGAGMVVTKSTQKEEYASVVFLKWFTDSERNLEFSCDSGYLPVKGDNYNMEKLDKYFQNNEVKINELVKETLNVTFGQYSKVKMYTNKAFDGGSEARKILENSMRDKSNADREKIIELLSSGTSYEEAIGLYDTDENFEEWFNEFKELMENAIE